MYAWYQQIHAPTGVERCAFCYFTSEKEKDLIVTAASQLTVYRLRRNVELPGKTDNNDETFLIKDKLEQLGTWQLFGNIVSMNSVRLTGAPRDSLLLSFKEAKLSLVEFDVLTHDIKTSSLHYFEDNLYKEGLIQRVTLPKVTVDPEGRCASLQLSTNTVAIIPFKTKDVSLASDENVLTGEATAQGKRSNATTSYSIDLREVDTRLQRIIDTQFLHGYYEPTLLILFESLRTWAGRVALRQDTCNIVAISLNMAERLHPVIWSLHGLPFDCKYAYAVPKPIGGVLIFAVNSLLHLNQSVPPYGTSLNSLTQSSTSFSLKPQEDVCLTLDCSKATFISPESLVVSLKGGELYVLTLLVDSMRSVRNFHFDKAASSVLASCITTMDDGFVFLGSRLGNSLLLHYTEARTDTTSTASATENDEPAAKRKRLNTGAEWSAADNDADDFDMYGRDTVTSEPLSSYNFEVCDSLLNIGPCGAAELGEPPFLSEEFVSQRESDLELALLSGYGKNGAMSILQRTVKPQIVTTFELPGCVDMWTVCMKPKEPPAKEFINQHGYLVLSREDTTLILETGKEIMEVEESGYNTRQSTVFVGNVGGHNNFILQVCAGGVWLMEGVKLLQQIPIDLGSPIVQCSLMDPYAMLLTADGQFVMLALKEADNDLGYKLHCSNPSLSQVPQVKCICLYADASELFATKEQPSSKVASSTDDMISDDDYKLTDKWGASAGKDDKGAQSSQSVITADEEDELLYGESDPDAIFTPHFNVLKPPTSENESQGEEHSTKTGKEKTFWAALVRDNGSFEIYEAPSFKLVYMVKNFTNGPKLLVDSSSSFSFSEDTAKSADPRHTDGPHIFEVLLVGLGYKKSRPHLLARVDEELLIYEAFSYKVQDKSSRTNSLQIRFKKVNHNIMIRRLPGSYDAESERQFMDRQTRLRPFENVGGYAGVFLCGPYPHWIFVTVRGALHCHPMTVDGPVSCFVSFHNVNCPHGFLYFNQQGELRICMLPPHMKYDNLWPVRKVSLKSTPHFIIYSIEHKVYALASSVSEPCTRLPYLNCDNEREFEDIDRGERFVYPHIDKFSVQLISPVSWELIPNARIDMEEFEHITCMKNVWLSCGTDSSVRRNYVVLGTCNIMGEELSSRGKIIILEVIEVVPEPGQPLTKNKLKQLYSEEQKGPVTSVCGVEGNLLAAIGQKVFIWRFDENHSLRGVAFVDTNVYVHHAFSFRSFAVIADIQKSLALLRYQEDFKTLSVTSRDIRPMDVYTADLLVDGQSLGFVGSDHEKNLVIFIYDANEVESHGGSRLIRCADMHIGSHVNCMWRIGSCPVDKASNTANEPYATAHVTMMATLDGSICNILPIAEKIYRRLLMLQNIMGTNLQHTAGLNPKGFRLHRSQQRALINPAKNMLDGDLLWRFKDLSFVEKQELAKKIGTTSDQILDDFMDIQRATVVM